MEFKNYLWAAFLCVFLAGLAACQQTTPKNPDPNQITPQFRLQWSSIPPIDQRLKFNYAQWRNNNEIYLGGNNGSLFNTDSFALKTFGHDNFDEAHGFSGDWYATWNPQKTELLSGDFWWGAESMSNPLPNNNGAIPSLLKSIINEDYQNGYNKRTKIAKWNTDGTLISIWGFCNTCKFSVLDTTSMTEKSMFEGYRFQEFIWIDENKIFALVSDTIDDQSYYKIFSYSEQSTVLSIKVKELLDTNNLQSSSILRLSPNRQKAHMFGLDKENQAVILVLNSNNLQLIRKINIARYSEGHWLSDDKTMAISSPDGTIEILDTETGEFTRRIENFKNLTNDSRIGYFQFSPNQHLLMVLNSRGEAILYDAHTLEEVYCHYCIADKHSSNVYQLSLSQDQKNLFSVGRDGTLKNHDYKYGVLQSAKSLETMAIYSLAQSNQNTYATAGEDSLIHLWDKTTQEEIGALTGHTYTIRNLAWKPNSTTLASAGWDETVRIWNTQTQTLEQTHTDYVNAVQYNPSGTTLASASSDGMIKLRNADTGQTLHTLQPQDSSSAVFTIAYSSDGAQLASGSLDHRVRIWDTTTQTLTSTLKGHLGAVRTLVWLNPTTLATGGIDGRIIVWDVPNQKILLEIKPDLGAVFTLTATQDGKTIYAGFDSGNLAAWKVTP